MELFSDISFSQTLILVKLKKMIYFKIILSELQLAYLVCFLNRDYFEIVEIYAPKVVP